MKDYSSHFIALLCLFLFINSSLLAQLNYYSFDEISIIRDGRTLKNPFVGGFNSPQFAQIDLDLDGKLDLLVFDRASEKLSPFINRGNTNEINYEFSPEYLSLFPDLGTQLYTYDYDCDGDLDLIIGKSDLRVYKNMSLENGSLSFEDQGKIWSLYEVDFPNQPKLVFDAKQLNLNALTDVDGDGDMDIIAEFGNGNQVEYHRNLSKERTGECGLDFERRANCWGDFSESNISDDIYLDSCRWNEVRNPEQTSNDSIFKPNQNQKGLKHGNTAVAAFDIDHNGSIDLLMGDDGSNRLKALYNSDSVNLPRVNSHIFKVDSTFPSYNTPVNFPVFATAFNLDINNDSYKDILVSTNSSDFLSPSLNKNHIWYYKQNPQTRLYEFQTEKLFFDDILDFGEGSFPTFFDFNKDGKQDLLVGNFGYYDYSDNADNGQLGLLLNTGTSSTAEFTLVDTNFLNMPQYKLLSGNLAEFNLIPTAGDLDGDGDEDLLIGSTSGKLIFFEDTSSQSSPAAFQMVTTNYQLINSLGNSAPDLYDVNGDGLLDLIIGNSSGLLDYYENMGSSTEPVFNIAIQTIQWIQDTTQRLFLEGTPDLTKLQIGQKVKITGSLKLDNNVEVEIVGINQSQNSLDVKRSFFVDSNDDEGNSPAYVDPSIKQWGNISLYNLDFNYDAVPFLYKGIDGKNKLLVGSQKGNILFFDNVSNSPNDTFQLYSMNYLNRNLGRFSSVTGSDLNGDSLIDLVIGNKAGGLNFFFGLNNVGINEVKNQQDVTFEVFPNPTNNQILIKIDKNLPLSGQELIEIYDLTGRLIKTEPLRTSTISVSELNNGLYLILLKSPTYRTKSKKLIIRK